MTEHTRVVLVEMHRQIWQIPVLGHMYILFSQACKFHYLLALRAWKKFKTSTPSVFKKKIFLWACKFHYLLALRAYNKF